VIARFDAWTFDTDRRLVTGDRDKVVHLTPKAFDLLAVLVEEAPRVVRKDELHRRLWPDAYVADATLVGLVREVRRAFLDAGHEGSLIRTSHGVGYAFTGTLEPSPSSRNGVDYWLLVAGRRVLLDRTEIVLGRDPMADVRLDAAGVSRRHARIVIGAGGASLEDLGSKNGTKLGETICAGRVALQDGDTIRLGPVSMIFRASRSGMSTVTMAEVAVD
jgi:DNA-binding winged helix-turn-helix (wHTH) protein